MYKPFAIFISSIAIAIVPWSFISKAKSTEYIFTAPPEVDRQLKEIPASETDYPLYECDASPLDSTTESPLDSHDCNCTECEDLVRDSEPERQTSQNKQDRE